ncbi:MAG: Mu-like prophage protein [Pseudomonadota bacterium]|jgi:phage gp29-like protein
MAPILDQWGNPVSSQALVKPAMGATVTGVRDTFDDFMASRLTPARMARILRDAAMGEMYDFLTLAEEMEEIEPQYASVISTRKRAIQSIELQVEASGDSAEEIKLADAVRENIAEHPGSYDLIGDLLDGLGKGYSVVEIVWDVEGRQWRPERFEWHDPRLFQFDRLTRKELRKRVQADFNGAPLEPFKFIRHIPKLKSGIPARNGLARLALWVFLLKTYSLKDWAAFLEVHGMPLRLGKYGASASEADKRVLLNAVRNLGSDAAAIVPTGMEIEFVETKGFSEKPFEGFAMYLDKAMSKAIIGQTMTTDEGSSLGQAKVHENVRIDIKKADARQLNGTLARDLVRPYVDLNHGPRDKYPKVHVVVIEPEDIKTLSEALSKLVPLGLKVQSSAVRDRIGFADPDEGAEVLGAQPAPKKPAAPAKTPPANPEPKPALNRMHGAGCPCCGAGPRALNAEILDPEDERDGLVEEALADWEPDMRPVLDAIVAATAKASNFAELEAALDRLTGDLPTDNLARRIAMATLKARGLGEVSDDPAR